MKWLAILSSLFVWTFVNAQTNKPYDPKRVDFSGEVLARVQKGNDNIVRQLGAYDLSTVFITPNDFQNGILGVDYKRIMINISDVTKDPNNSLLYNVTGKSNVLGNVCDFAGTIELMSASRNGDSEFTSPDAAGFLIARYTLYEKQTQPGTGVFKGAFDCAYHLDAKSKMGFVDAANDVADGYANRTYVGTWTSYKTNTSKKCIWGDYRLPYTNGFDCGDGEMIVCDAYVKNGWESFNVAVQKGWYEKKTSWFKPAYLQSTSIGAVETVIDLDNNFTLIATVQPFDSIKHTVQRCEGRFVCKLDGVDYFGCDGGLPSMQLQSLVLQQKTPERSVTYDLQVDRMFDPAARKTSLDKRHFKLQKNADGSFTVYGSFSDGAGSYTAHWRILANNAVRMKLSRDDADFSWMEEKH